MDYSEQTRQNKVIVLAAEALGSPTVDGWPIKITFEFTANCNLHCFMCDCEILRDQYRGQGVKLFTLPKETFDVIVKGAFPWISVVNPTVVGEPMVLPYFDDLVEACEKYDVRLDLISNGTMIRGQRLRRLMPRLASLALSIDGASKEVFDHIRTGGDFDEVRENMAEFSRLRGELGLREQIAFGFNVTIMAENVHELPAIVELAAANDVDSVAASYMIVFGERLKASSPLLDPTRTNRFVAEARARAKELGLKVFLPSPLPEDALGEVDVIPKGIDRGAEAETEATTEGLGVEADSVPEDGTLAAIPAGDYASEGGSALVASIPDDWQGKLYCRYPWREAFVSQGGEVSPCCAQGRPVFGNIFEEPFEGIWNGPGYKRLREGIFNGDPTDYCRDCTFLQEAGGVPFDPKSYSR